MTAKPYRYRGDPDWDPAKLGPTEFAGVGANHAHDNDQREHGTRRGYDQHKRAGDEPCDECVEANRQYNRELRKNALMRGRK